ncbi:hypothetical protein HOI18_00875 [Candidatus Uhrbacteria bacterium]|jgi:hypothetical protein|nr:hypothetical protein [Candidatus Uhrbacteria bacterium]
MTRKAQFIMLVQTWMMQYMLTHILDKTQQDLAITIMFKAMMVPEEAIPRSSIIRSCSDFCRWHVDEEDFDQPSWIMHWHPSE